MGPKRIAALIGFTVLLVFGIVTFHKLVYWLDAGELAMFQTVGGDLSMKVAPGPYKRLWADITIYRKQDTYSFEWDKNQNLDKSIQVQFNDGGKAWIGGNVQWEMPTDQIDSVALHTLYNSQEGIDRTLIRNAINRAITLTAPLMSATESYAARRGEFLQMFADQLVDGIYQMRSHEVRQPDPITGEMKTIRVVDIVKDDKTGLPMRAEESPLKKYHILIQTPTITHFVYEDKVEQQIQQVRDNTMKIQTQQAQAKSAEQAKLTAAAEGEAKAATAKWEQETVKAREVTKAEQEAAVQKLNAEREATVQTIAANRDKIVAETAAQRELQVATLAAQAAEQYKRKQILEGEGDAEKRRLILAADGALQTKVEAAVRMNADWANAYRDFKGQIVPTIQMSGNEQGSAANPFAFAMQAMGLKAMKDLQLDLSLPAQPQGPKK